MFYNNILFWYSKNPRLILFTFILGVFPLFYPKHLGSEDSSPWFEKLPTCPCENPDLNGVKIGDGWAEDKGNIEKYHKGAAHSYRSYPYVKTNEGKSGQQCCYDINGKLLFQEQLLNIPFVELQNELKGGTYLYQLKQGTTQYSGKVVVPF
jgi:hypothetical protein